MDSSGMPWLEVFTEIMDGEHLATGGELASLLDHAVARLDLTAELLLADLSERTLFPLGHDEESGIDIEGTIAGRAYQLSEILAEPGRGTGRALWLPLLDGSERIGVMRIGLGGTTIDDAEFRHHCRSLAGFMAHLVMSKMPYSDRLHRIRAGKPLSPAAELLWQLLPPRTSASEQVVVSALLVPQHGFAGDAYDYAIDEVIELAVFDGVGHDIQAGLTTALAITAIRNARRSGEHDLVTLARHADELLRSTGLGDPTRFVTAALARLDTTTGVLHYLLAGHPPPLLLRGGRAVKELNHVSRPPLGIPPMQTDRPTGAQEQLEAGDRLLLYSDGITEARDSAGVPFGQSRLIDFAERAMRDKLPAPETLRRLAAEVLAHQSGLPRDDATLVMLDWSTAAHQYLFPTLTGRGGR